MHLIATHPCIVILNDVHNHTINTAEALKYRDLSEEATKKIIDLFYQGHNASSALKSYKTSLMLEQGHQYYKVAADGRWMPTLSVVHKLFEKVFSKSYGAISGEEMFLNLSNMLSKYVKDNDGKAIATLKRSKDLNHYFVIICTPMMLRVHERIHQSGEVVMLDAAGGVDKQRHRVYFFVTPCVVGGLPLGLIITDSEEATLFTEAVECFKELLPAYSSGLVLRRYTGSYFRKTVK